MHCFASSVRIRPVAVAYSYFDACAQEGRIIALHTLAVMKVSACVCHDVYLKGSLNFFEK